MRPNTPSPTRRPDGRWLAAGLVALYLVILGSAWAQHDLTPAWMSLGVPAMEPHFADLLNVAAGIRNQAAGQPVGAPNPYDPFHRPYIYPAPWLLTKYFGLGFATTATFAFLMAGAFWIAAWLALGRLSRWQGVYAGLFLCSPAVMTAVERANIDLVLFVAIVFALVLRHRTGPVTAVLAVATILKFHPLGAFLALAAPPWRRHLPWLAAGLALAAGYWLLHLPELRVIDALTPRYPFYSFGSATLGLARAALANVSFDYDRLWLEGSGAFTLLLALATAFRPRLAPEPPESRPLFGFRLAAGLFLASFALGASNDYRVLFLVPGLPWLFAQRHAAGAVRHWTTVALALILVFAGWDLVCSEFLWPCILAKQAVAWILAAALAGLAVGTIWPTAPPRATDIFDVVDRDDRVVGRAPRAEVHAKGLLHRAVHVLVHDEAGRLFLQQRSLTKDTFPGCWDSSCSGHLDTGETYEIAARRELGEELGFTDAGLPLRPIVKLEAQPETGHEFIQIYALGPTRGPFTLHPEEIIGGRWIAPADLTDALAAEPDAYASALRHLWQHHRAVVLAELQGNG